MIFVGSVKSLDILIEASKNVVGEGIFNFSDDFSVFDWGKMPDVIPFKGAALCIMSAVAFENLRSRFGNNIQSHYRGLNGSHQELQLVRGLSRPTTKMKVDLFQVIKPVFKNGEYDYSALEGQNNYLIPLEIIYRLGLPPGSSIFRRLKEKKLDYRDLGLDEEPIPGQRLPKPYFEVTTKLEETDRPVTWQEAEKFAHLQKGEIEKIKEILSRCIDVINTLAEKAGLQNEDGKIELALGPHREIVVVDVFGTLDECRFTYQGISISKEMLRQYYDPTPWKKEVDDAKKYAKENGIENWKQFVSSSPPRLPEEWINTVSWAYQAVANKMLGKDIFPDVPSIPEIIKLYKHLCESL